jgi:2-oxoglutarate ferredoxin oxidoreductase subunit delta
MAKAKGRIAIDEEFCKGCALCSVFCPLCLIVMADRTSLRGYHPARFVDPEAKCTACAICARMCPDVAITVYRQNKGG